MKCSECIYSSSTYPLDPRGSLYCEFIEDYVTNKSSCDKFIVSDNHKIHLTEKSK